MHDVVSPTAAPDNLGGLMRRQREQLALPIREVARRVGVSPSYLFALETGRNPTTGRPPVPSPPILAAIGRTLDLDLSVLLELVGAPATVSPHQLLYQLGSGHRSPLPAARRLFDGSVDAWVEVTDPRCDTDSHQVPHDVIVRHRGPLGPLRADIAHFNRPALVDEVTKLLGRVPHSAASGRLGIVFGATSALLCMADNPHTLLGSETTWEHDIGAQCRRVLGGEPAANICVYRQADIQELSSRIDPLATVIGLVLTHPRVAVETADGTVTTGPAATETMLATVRPAGVTDETWTSLSHAAAIGFTRDAGRVSATAIA